MLRVVADANVLISAALARSPNAPSVLILEAALDGRLDLVTSPQLLGEITSVLKRPRLRKYLSTDEELRFVAGLATQTILLTDPPGPPAAVCRDPDDDYLVALATARHADAIVSGDPDLHAIDNKQLDIEILTPRQLVAASPDGRLFGFFRTPSPLPPINPAQRDGAGPNRRRPPPLKAKLVVTARKTTCTAARWL